MKKRTLIWDLPTRLFHWGLAASVLTSWVAVEFLDDMDLHLQSGFVAAVLLIFRVIWGVIGSETSRFTSFVRGPAAILDYLRVHRQGGHWKAWGHNPLGALSVVGLIGILTVQVGTGLFSNDDVFFDGPWSGAIGKEMSDTMTGYHDISGTILQILIVLHLVAIAYYRFFRKDDLIKPMITGEKAAEEGAPPAPAMRSPLVALAVLAIAVAAAGVIFRYWLT